MRFHKGFGHIGIVEVIRLENLFLVFLFARLSKVAETELAFWSSKKREGKKDIITQVVLWVVIQATDMPTYSKPNQVLKQVVCSMQCCQSRGAKGYASLGPKKLGVLLHKFEKLVKVGSVEERLYKKTSLYSKFEFSFSVALCLPFKEMFCSVFQ